MNVSLLHIDDSALVSHQIFNDIGCIGIIKQSCLIFYNKKKVL